jgi:pimeloyl-ACP methyl ester carboxylesterase
VLSGVGPLGSGALALRTARPTVFLNVSRPAGVWTTSDSVIRSPMPAGLDTFKKTVGRAVLSASAPLPKGPTPLSTRAVHYMALGPDASPAAVAFTEQLVLECPRDARAGVGSTLSRLDLYESVACLRVPTVVIAGERDRLSPPAHSRKLADALPELVELAVIPGSGHMTPLEMPDEATSRIAELARRHL